MIRFATLSLIIASTLTAHADSREHRVSLDEALALSLQNNPDLAVAGFAPRRATAEVTRQQGTFDPVFSLFAGLGRDKTPQLTSTYRNTVVAEASIGGRLPTGTEYALSYGTTRLDSDLPFAPLNPSSTGFVQLDLRQPLLRGFGRDVNNVGVDLARGDERIAQLRLRRQTELTITNVVDAYWRLVRAHKSLAVARESLRLAEQLVARTQTRVASGDLPAIELTQARASVAAREEAVILGEAEVGNANDALARQLAVDRQQVFDVQLTPTDEPTTTASQIERRTLLADALRQRADVQASRQAVLNAERALGAAHNARRPDLSAVASAGVASLDDRWPSSQTELVRDATDQYRWNVGLVFSVPLGNRAAEGGYDKARLAQAEARAALRSLELQVTEEVRTALRNLDASEKRIEATRRASELAREQLEAGEKRLGAGLSTAFEVLRLQTDLAIAQNAEINAMVGYRTSFARVQLATGALFETYVTPTERQ